jgi:hypothetical protein
LFFGQSVPVEGYSFIRPSGTNIIVGNASVDEEIIKHLLMFNLFAANECSPAIAAVISGRLSPQEAIDALYQSMHGEANDGMQNLRDRIGGSLN